MRPDVEIRECTATQPVVSVFRVVVGQARRCTSVWQLQGTGSHPIRDSHAHTAHNAEA